MFQNLILILIPIIATSLSSSEFRSVNAVLDYIFTFSMILDLVAVFLIGMASLKYFLSLKEKQGERDFRSRSFYIPFTGLLWVTCSFLWRLPYYLMGGFKLGLATEMAFVNIETNPTYDNLLTNPILHLFLILGAINLFLFLYFQDKDYLETFDLAYITSDLGNVGFGRSTILGAVNLIGVIFLFFGSTLTTQSIEYVEKFGTNPNGSIFIIGLLFKLVLIPPLAIWTSSKFLSANKLKLKVEKHENSKFMRSQS
ncbi:MAG: hypothetical protein KAT16_04330 [Candidatus Heimdallarchaeota archaeon]|nr:hypothetical protein [Candidatus Heimdallarchaeota archaeon]